MHESLQLLIQHGYSFLFLWVFAERLGIPIPATLPLIGAGILAEMEYMQFVPAVLLAFLAAMLADFAWFFLGRYRGSQILKVLCRISLAPDACVRKTENIFTKYGSTSLLFAKFVPGLNNVMVPLTGIMRIPAHRFIAFDSTGSLLWVGAIMGIGYFFSKEIDLERIAFPEFGQGTVIISVLVLLALFIAWKYLHRQRLIRGLFADRITPEELKQKMDAGEEIAVVDVRHPLEFEADPFMIPGAIYSPLEKIKQFSGVPVDREMVTYCA
ncbi:MAG TPA: VTT domain-containing protein [Syntrophales bacterium]|nr:VTT domain-containing protein [Syntrophales bacterium]